jgi:hypothetical protein
MIATLIFSVLAAVLVDKIHNHADYTNGVDH